MPVTDRDLGYAALLSLFRRLNTKGFIVRVGVLGAESSVRYRATPDPNPSRQRRRATTVESGPTLGEIAHMQEFGAGKIPPRPAFRQAFDENRSWYETAIRAVLTSTYMKILGGSGRNWAAGERELEKGLGVVGLQVVGDIQERIRNLTDPPNSAYTVWRKGSSNPLIDTGRLRQSISTETIRQVWKRKGPV